MRTTIVDLLPTEADPPLSVLFCGVNPGLSTVETGLHFHRPGNRFWRALHLAGFTPTVLAPEEQWKLPRAGLGITALVARATARADELSPAELVGNVPRLTDLLIRTRPAWLGFLGITAFRVAFRMPRAVIGRQTLTLAGTGVWVLPNPSGLNRSWTVEALGDEFGRLRREATGDVHPRCEEGLPWSRR
ncbi:G/U mismatch-specific DNA glycosylase [Pseudonocardia sp. CA-142604]|uniref:G/U mismatch-specific DNA glycosylase n=1 Tax=Pseudonocardia sp. CA-142604 TaxID=3240024 RepID=UPI003D90687E